MMRPLFILLLSAVVAFPLAAQQLSRVPHLGYVYPAGGKVGSTVIAVIGGQNLYGNLTGTVSGGDDVKITEIKLFQPFKNVNIPRKELQDLMRGFQNGKLTVPPLPPAPKKTAAKSGPSSAVTPSATPSDAKPAAMPPPSSKSPEPEKKTANGKPELTRDQLIAILKTLSPLELELLARDTLLQKDALQINPALAQKVIVKIVVATRAKPGFRELRLQNGDGLSNPIKFAVGTLPESKEPPFAVDRRNSVGSAAFPAVLNGQIMPGEVSCWKFRGDAGKPLTVTLYGRRLCPFLGDAVPGWFQPAIGVYDSRNRELAFADSGEFAPDPSLTVTLPAAGNYELRIRDTLYRGREDFVYRAVVTNQPPDRDLLPVPDALRQLPQVTSQEPNDTFARAQTAELPSLISGAIAPAGDTDLYRFSGHKGETIVAEVYARRLNSPLDSLLRLLDRDGRILAWNDDGPRPRLGTQTQAADSYLLATLPADGDYYLQLTEAQGHGGPGYVYWLRLDRPHPDFELYLTPSALNVPSGLNAVFTVAAVRRDGFAGEIEVVWPEAPTGFRLSGGLLPAGCDQIRMTLSAPDRLTPHLEPARLIGQAAIGGHIVKHDIVPADEQMQAFAYTHWVPAEDLTVAVLRRMHLPVTPECPASVLRIAPGQTAALRLPTAKMKPDTKLVFELVDPPAGITLAAADIHPEAESVLTFHAADTVKPGTAGNLILHCGLETAVPQGRNGRNGYSDLGFLPAIPLEVILSPTTGVKP